MSEHRHPRCIPPASGVAQPPRIHAACQEALDELLAQRDAADKRIADLERQVAELTAALQRSS